MLIFYVRDIKSCVGNKLEGKRATTKKSQLEGSVHACYLLCYERSKNHFLPRPKLKAFVYLHSEEGGAKAEWDGEKLNGLLYEMSLMKLFM
jgi:hypothetical protein